MMLVVPLSSCITDNSNLSDNSGTLSGTAPTPPTSPFTPGKYTIEYHDGDKSFSKTYNGTFAYAARLPDGWGQDSKVFAGWSTSQPSADPAAGEGTSPNYLVYDDIEYDDNGIPVGADSSSFVLNLYAVWLDAPVDGKLNTVYLSGAGDDTKDGKTKSTAVKTFSQAYSLLDSKGTTTTNRIVICGDITLTDTQIFLGPFNSHVKATISAIGEAKILFERGKDRAMGLRADTVFENISFGLTSGNGNPSAFIYCNGYSLTIGENVNTDGLGHRGDNTNYGIPDNYKFITICAGGLGKETEKYSYDINDVDGNQPNMNEASRSPDSPVTIKLLSGEFGRISGSGRSYGDSLENSLANPIYSRIIVWGDDSNEQTDTTDAYHANIGTLAGGHIDSNTAGGAEIEVRSGKVINLIGGNVGNSARDNTFFGNIEVTVYDGTVGVIYGAGLGRLQNTINPKLQVTLSGTVTINICGGTIGLDGTDKNLIETSGNVYGGGAASQTLYSNNKYSEKSEIIVNIFGGKILGNVYGGGYGYSEYITDKSKYDKLKSGDVNGDITVNIVSKLNEVTIGTYDSNGILQEGGNVYGGGKGYFATGSTNTSTAQVSGNTNVNIFSGNLGSVYGGGEGIDGYQDIAKVSGDTSVYVLNGNIFGNIYGGGSIAVVTDNIGTSAIEGNTSVTVAGGKIGGTADWGRVFGGGEGNITSDWAGQVTGSTNVTISNGTILGSVYGGGNFGVVGTENAPDSSINISISGSPDIAGNVYGGGKGDKGDISDGYQPADPDGIISNEIKKGNVYGNTSVTISGGKIGYLNGSSEQSWYDSEDSGSVYGGGKLGLVVGTTDVTISGNAEIHRNVYGGGKGLSKSVYIETDGNSISASLYNMTQILSPEDQITMESALWSNPSFVSKYIWEGSTDLSSGFETIRSLESISASPNGHSISSSEVTPYKFIRLTVKITNEVIGTESISSNVISTSDLSKNASKESWMVENRKLVQFGAVTEGTEVNISGGSIHTNVYGGGSYATVGTITGQASSETEGYNFKHMISGGSTKVAINGGQIGVIRGTSGDTHSEGGNVFGGGMGEPDNITTGSVGKSASIIISNGKINGNVYGGGENGFVGQVEIEISPTMTPIPLNNDTNLITYAYGLRISNSIGNETVGITNVTVSGGTVGDESELNNLDSGNIFGAGKGVNATVTGRSSVTIGTATTSGPTVNGNVYGGGDLGAVGQLEGTSGKDISLTGGTANVTINSGEINGSVFGGGKGQSKSVSAEALILGTVQNTNVNITGGSINRINGDNPRGNVYGGGELGLVGALAELTEKDVIDNLKFTFTDGSTSVIISGSTTIAGNVYGGGKGEDGTITHSEAPLTTIILGSVAKSTEVKISERVSIGTAISGNLVDGTGNVYGGGELGIVGTYSDSNTDNTRIYVGGNSTIVISGGTILNEVYGGGEGTPKNVLSGAVGNATTIVSGSTTTIKGNVYGGGAYSIVGGTNVTIDRTPKDGKIDPKITAATNDATVNVVILGGTIKPDEFINSTGSNLLTSSMGNVFGGGYGPKATVAGSTYIFIGKQDTNDSKLNNLIQNTNQTAITIFGNVFGGGDMGSIGFDANTSQVDTPEFGKDYGTSKPSNISSNVSIKTYGTNITIGGISKNDKVGNIYAGGRGGNLIHIISNDLEKYETLKGYAIVHGDSNLIIEGTGNGNITISGSIYGAGQGVPDVTTPGRIDVILYAAVTGNTSISISKANVNNVYGGGQLSILGWYYDDSNPSLHGASDGVANKDYRHYTGSDTKIIINNSNITGSVYGGGMGTTANAISGAVGESTVIIGGGSKISGDVYGGGAYAVVSNKLVVDRTSVDNNIRPTIADSDNISKAVIVILNAEISGNVFGGGYGPRAVIAGSTHVFIGISSDSDYPSTLIGSMANGAYHANITGSVYGGGNMGSVGFIEHLEGTDNEASFPLGYGPISSVSSNVILSLNDNKNAGTGENNRITVGGDVYGGGKGGDLYIPLLPSGASSLDAPPTTIKPEGWIEGISGRTLYGYAIVHGSSNVSITGVYSPGKGSLYIDISGNIFGGGEGIEASKGQNSLDVIVYAAVTGTSSVTISHSHIHGDIYGGGNLGVVGYFIDSDHASNSSNIFRNFTGKESNVKINASLIEGTVFGGGRGTTNNILSGAVGNTNVTIMGEEVTPIDGRDIAAASTITGSVYGGGAYALVGSMGITITVTDGKKSNPTVTECSNSSTTTVIILNSTIGSETQTDAYGGSGNVFGGGYGPRAVIAGSTNVYIGSGASNITSSAASSVTIYGSVFGGGNM